MTKTTRFHSGTLETIDAIPQSHVHHTLVCTEATPLPALPPLPPQVNSRTRIKSHD